MPPVLTATASEIQDMIIARARTLPMFTKVFATPMETWQGDDLPALAVFLVEEDMQSDGDAGEPHFLHTAIIGVQAVVMTSDVDEQRAQIVAALGQLDTAILTDPATLMPIEEIKRIFRRFKYERVAETPIAHLSMAITLTFRSRWAPVVPYDFNVLHVETAFPAGGDTTSVIQVKAVWDIPQN
jgi:hypothetical protein